MKRLIMPVSGLELLYSPRWNKGTAFDDRERDEFDLHGLLPPYIGTLELQVERRQQALAKESTALAKYSFLRDLQDSNETLFYALLQQNIEQMLPLVYTPTVGEGCQHFSEIWRKPRGIFLSYPNRERIAQILSHSRYDDIRCIVVSDGERILGLGDQGAGGMGIPIGKLALYTALAGIHPEYCLPVLLDVGTNNHTLLQQPLYVGWRHERVRGGEYDAFVDSFVRAVEQRWPHVLLQWEDFAGANAARLLQRYRDQLCTFNDDIQGTAAVATATLISAINVTGVSLDQQRIVVVGFGSAGLGITTLLAQYMKEQGVANAASRFYPIDRDGLLTDDMPALSAAQRPYARARSEGLGRTLEEVVRQAKPTVLIGVSGQAGAFTEPAVREMARHVRRPVIFPLSNPISRSEAAPQDLMDWSEGRALIGTGSPYEPVTVAGRKVPITQTNNSYIFPGLALGIIASRARRVTDGMIMAAARELARHAPTREDKDAPLLPPIVTARALSRAIAVAVGRQAVQDGEAQIATQQLESQIDAQIWQPEYCPYERARSSPSIGG